MPVRNVADAMREYKAGTSPHFQSRAQAVAIGLKAQRSGKVIGGRKSPERRSQRRAW